MDNSSTVERSPSDSPPAPSVCDDCGCGDLIPRSKPPSQSSGENLESKPEYVFAYHECSECGARYNDRSSQLLQSDNIRAPDWTEVFGHPSPYEHQKDGIEHCINTARSSGYTVMEGGCGTGKTMISLTAGLTLVKDPRSRFERIMVLTSVKQQLRQFEDDLRIINQNLPADVPSAKAVTLVGKADLCPYSREETAGISTENVASRCRTLRDKTSKLMSNGSDGIDLARQASPDISAQEWESSGVQSPYADSIPESGLEYCPFYANYKEHEEPLFTFGHAPDCILDPDEIVSQAVDKGVCPHSAMSVLCRDAEVIIANYYHAFDQNTLNITNSIIDDTTLLVCDEAHMLEPRVRDILSESVPSFQIGRAADEIVALLDSLNNTTHSESPISSPPRGVVTEQLSNNALTDDHLSQAKSVLRQLQAYIGSVITSYLDENYHSWRSSPGDISERVQIPLRNPDVIEPDMISDWAESKSIPDSFWEALPTLADVVEDVLTEDADDGESDYAITAVADLLDQWFRRDHTSYFRKLTLTSLDSPHYNADGWKQTFYATVELHSVMPQGPISGTLDRFGGGVLMSATLEPIDVYEEVTGLSYLSNMQGELVTQRTYTADFPTGNRLSITLDLPKFTYSNRGDIDESTQTRHQYAQAIQSVAKTTPGNVLVCLPSYREAQWGAALLEQTPEIRKEVLLDESSGEEQTQQLKQQFYAGDAKVLVTSLRGTLTEGVDFDGDKLRGCIVCGVPIENVESPQTKALTTAYQDSFGGIGFQYGLTVPAVRKTRQALGRVIRGTDDVGVRVAADTRYTDGGNTVRRYLSEDEQDEYTTISDINTFASTLTDFWSRV